MRILLSGLSGLYLLFSSSFVYASFPYENAFDLHASKSIQRLEILPIQQNGFCEGKYKEILNDGVLDIRVAFGYFDANAGFGFSSTDLSVDRGADAALRTALLAPCRKNARFCGFQVDPQNSYALTRTVDIQGRTYTARVEIYHSSFTDSLRLNKNIYGPQQLQQTQYVENFFSSSLQTADATFYFGHSRFGGGPDFAMPVYIPGSNRLDYENYYLAQKPGLSRMIAALSGAPKPSSIIGLMTPDSYGYFLEQVRLAAPTPGIITSYGEITYLEVYSAMIGAIDGLLQGKCGSSYYQSLRLTKTHANAIFMDGSFVEN